MSPKRFGPLFLLALAVLLTAATWTTVSAAARRGPSFTSPDPGTRVDAPIFTPTSGEPDVGGTPAPPRSISNGHHVSNRAVAPSWFRLSPWFRLVMRTWSVWFTGLS
jgi:hypothetical protein